MKKNREKKKNPVIRTAFVFLVAFTVSCGGLYTVLCTGIAQLFFPGKANGSIIEIDGKKYGSTLLAQEFTGEEYLWGRIMNIDSETYTDDEGNIAVYSGPSNQSPAGEELEALVAERVEKQKEANPDMAGEKIPVDLVTASGSGLDPEISPAAAKYQIARVAKARDMKAEEVRAIVEKYTTGRAFGVFGEPRVNVLKVNLALDGILK
ncbi:MAG: potassium-transporting ATPase subunit KdpC [Blautia sp.]